MAYVIGVSSGKGGSGKTTGTLGIASRLAARGLTVVMPDWDPQGNLTKSLGVPMLHPEKHHLGTAVLDQNPYLDPDVLVQVDQNLYLIPSSIGLEFTHVDLLNKAGAELRAGRALADILTFADVLVIDFPSTFNRWTDTGYMVCSGRFGDPGSGVVIATAAEPYFRASIETCRSQVGGFAADMGVDIDMLGLFCTRYNAAEGKLYQDIHAEIEKWQQPPYLGTVNKRVALAQLWHTGKAMSTLGADSPIPAAFDAVVNNLPMIRAVSGD